MTRNQEERKRRVLSRESYSERPGSRKADGDTERERGKKVDEVLTITAKEKAQLLLKRKHPDT